MKRSLSGAAAALAFTTGIAVAHASSGADSPENGIVQMGRGSAWVARAEDPLAVYYNPAALAFQATGVHVGSTFMFANKCFTRVGVDGKPVAARPELPAPGEVCAEAGISPNPQAAATFRITDKLAIGIALVAPHAVGGNVWPETVKYKNDSGFEQEQPAPQRYLLISSNAIILKPTVAVSFAPLDNLSFGAGFIWGVASAEFVSFSEALSSTGPVDDFVNKKDVKGTLNMRDLFIPGFVIGGLWSPNDLIDVGAWLMWMDRVDASADIRLESRYFNFTGVKEKKPCLAELDEPKDCNITDKKGAGRLGFSIPMEVKFGTRFHWPRAKGGPKPAWGNDPKRRVRDPMSEDLFDIELDFTWAHNGDVDEFSLTFPGGAKRIRVNGTPGQVPENANLPRQWKDVMGVHLGGDFVVIPNRFAVRGGAWFEAKGQDDEYLALDFNLAEKVGLTLGTTVRIGPVDVSAAFQHTFFGTLDNGGKGKVKALSGDATTEFRSQQAVNGGSLKQSLNEFGLAGTLRF